MTRTIARIWLMGLLLLALPPAARAAPLTLADLASGSTFSSLDGTLSFGSFSVMQSGSVSSPLTDFEVVTLIDGFEVVGPFSAFDGELGGMSIDYTVTASLPLERAHLSFNGAAFGVGAEARVDESFASLSQTLLVQALPGSQQLSESVSILGVGSSLMVVKQISLTSVPSGAAQISLVAQRFEVVPEPSVAVLLLLGTSGLFVARRRR
ncbi:MAG: PEP-CTERM sorting domain-containing protein [Myxococcota bacterium]